MKNKALFLDRDGVINREINYLIKKEDVHFIPGIFELTRRFQQAGYLLIVITNQAGIGRGYYSEKDFLELTQWIGEQFNLRGVTLTETFYCPYHPEHGIGSYRAESPDRKPGPGMILKATEKYDIDPARSLFLGDRDTDMQAALNAGIPERILFDAAGREITTHATRIISDLSEVVPQTDKDLPITVI